METAYLHLKLFGFDATEIQQRFYASDNLGILDNGICGQHMVAVYLRAFHKTLPELGSKAFNKVIFYTLERNRLQIREIMRKINTLIFLNLKPVDPPGKETKAARIVRERQNKISSDNLLLYQKGIERGMYTSNYVNKVREPELWVAYGFDSIDACPEWMAAKMLNLKT